MSEQTLNTDAVWTQRWGINGDRPEVEQAMSLVAGRYTTQRTTEKVTLPDPHYPAQSQSFSIEVATDQVTGRVWKFGFEEITNGIYALIYRPVSGDGA